MGFFSTKKVYVSSVVYNLAGDYDQRVDYLKSSVVGAVVSARQGDISTALTACFLNSSGCKLKNFMSWAEKYYFPIIGSISANFYNPVKLDTSVLKTEMDKILNEDVQLQTTSTGLADYTYWAEQRVLQTRPDQLEANWPIGYNETTGVMTITYPDGQIDTFSPDIRKGGMYIYASYTTGKHNDNLQMFIYRRHSGNANLDAQFGVSSGEATFYPPIPFRLNNKFISDDYMPDLYKASVKAFKRATGTKYSVVQKAIADNKDIKDIDYAYAVFGVSLNSKDNTCKKYLYTFFHNLFETQRVSTDDLTAWEQTCQQAADTNSDWGKWMKAQSDPKDPLYGTTAPNLMAYPDLPSYDVHIKTSNLNVMNYDIQIQWAAIAETHGIDIRDPKHAVGDLWFTVNDSLDVSNIVWNGKGLVRWALAFSSVTLYWQKTSKEWSAMTIWGLKHHNRIYGGKSVDIDAADALASKDESGFIIPLEETTIKSMSLLDVTQMTTECCYIVFNCYKVVKKKWYQTGLFKVLFLVAMIAVAVFTAGAGTIGLLGTNLAIGTALGLTGTAAIMIGALVNTIAAIVLTKVITLVSTKLLGKEVGNFIAAIISTVAIQLGSAAASGQSVGQAFAHLSTADKVMAASDAVKGGMSLILEEKMKKIQNETAKLLETVEKQESNLESKTNKILGVSQDISPLDLTESYNQMASEGMENFLARTLMTGSDVASFQQDGIHKMFDLTLDLPFVSSIYNQ